ncbi:unnamed protein product [Prunus armeniaca]
MANAGTTLGADHLPKRLLAQTTSSLLYAKTPRSMFKDVIGANHNSPWPFMQWAIDLVGPMPPEPTKKDMMIVAPNYFTKWIKAKALSFTKEVDFERFI